MSRYEVRFKSSDVVAFSATERGICQHWVDCNDYEPEKPIEDPETGIVHWVKGDCLGLFTIKRVK